MHDFSGRSAETRWMRRNMSMDSLNTGDTPQSHRENDNNLARFAMGGAEDDWERTFDAIPDMVAIVDDQHRIVRANRAMSERLGKSPAECVGLCCYRDVHGVDTPPDDCPHLQLLKDGQPHSIETCELGFGGHFSVSVSPLFDSVGRVMGSVHVARDITERRRTEEALRRSEEWFRSIFENSPEMIVLVDVHGNLVDVNHKASDLIRGPKEDLIGKHFLDLPFWSAKTKRTIGENFAARLRGEEVPPYEIELMRSDGKVLTCDIRGSLVRSLIDEKPQVLLIVSDVTQRKQAEESLEASRELYAAAARIGKFGHWKRDFVENTGYWSKETYDVFGLDPEHFVPTFDNFLSRIHPDDKEFVRNAVQSTLQTGRTQDIEYRIQRLDGEVQYIHSVAESVRDESGTVRMLVGTVHDITERKHAEQELQASEDLLNRTGDMARVGGWEINLDDDTVLWTHTTKMIHEVPEDYTPTLEEAIDFFPGDARQTIAEAVRRAREEGVSYDLEVPFRTATGKHLWTRTVGEPVFVDGKCVRLYGTFQDITRQKHSEQERQTSERRFKILAETVQDVFWISSPGNDSFYVSPAYQKIWGRSLDGYQEHPTAFLDAVLPDDKEAIISAVEQYHAKHWPYQLEYRIVRPDGTQRWILERGFPVRQDENSDPIMAGVCTDITERKQAEQAMLRREEELSKVYDSAPAIMIVVDEDQRIRRANRAAVEASHGASATAIAGLRGGEAIQCVHALDHPKGCGFGPACDTCGIRNMVLDAFRTGKAQYQEEKKLVRLHGDKTATVHLVASAVPLAIGDRPHVLLTLEDITERRLAEEAIREKDELLRQSQKMEAIGSLAGGIAHEFNNLLQIIQGYSVLVLDSLPPTSSEHQDLQRVVTASARATHLTRQLLDFGRRSPLQRENVNANSVVREAGEILQAVIDKRIRIEILLDERVGTVSVDPASLQQALLNLCVNAQDAMPSGGSLTISTRDTIVRQSETGFHSGLKAGRYVQVSVTDTGCGMSKETMERAFEPFFTSKKVGEGTGLGLAMVHGIVAQLEGTIRVSSELGRGTSFVILLPVVDVTPASSDETRLPTGPRSPDTGTRTILVAEDEPLVRGVIAQILQNAGYSTITAQDGEEAVRMARQYGGQISLALLDVVMPHMTGYEAYEQMRRISPRTRFAFCTGYDVTRTLTDSIRKTSLPVFEKPVRPDVLLQFVRDLLDSSDRP